MPKYHVALSFAGEDRKYVEKVAAQLAADGVEVFYDKFEEATLWGKDLYTHLKDVYENKALFTVMFISRHYRDKVWPKHERESAQARALESNKEYILPAFFDESVSVPGLSKTTGRISLTVRTPKEVAELIVKKLKDSGVQLAAQFAYSIRRAWAIGRTGEMSDEQISEVIREVHLASANRWPLASS